MPGIDFYVQQKHFLVQQFLLPEFLKDYWISYWQSGLHYKEDNSAFTEFAQTQWFQNCNEISKAFAQGCFSGIIFKTQSKDGSQMHGYTSQTDTKNALDW